MNNEVSWDMHHVAQQIRTSAAAECAVSIFSVRIYQSMLNCSLKPRLSLVQPFAVHFAFNRLQFVLFAQRNVQYGFFTCVFPVFLKTGMMTVIKTSSKRSIWRVVQQYNISTIERHFLFFCCKLRRSMTLIQMSYSTSLQQLQSSLHLQKIFIQAKLQYCYPLYAFGSQVAFLPADFRTRNCGGISPRDV